MKQLVEVTVARKESTCSHCKETIKVNQKVYLAKTLGLSCHFSCGPAAKKKTKKIEAATAQAQQRHWEKANRKKTAKDIEYHKALKNQRPL